MPFNKQIVWTKLVLADLIRFTKVEDDEGARAIANTIASNSLHQDSYR
ncbi:hypothetical protein MGA3_17602 (plasmid) [Bacillus methanolicus MGA3]|uniref:Uncharacterized protein n=1 Tax=Bacillus methanolicus (strain MGA3 / ATCC 53907) TaxID=796606 RepID=I3DTG5_BACMM|nr:hypothetical protein BMMGA3_16935 [Bacillus methanolicus MGA3]EIJ77536.1 hypothetical protein MGA3_17602 [Bacillus methanolicus MGA3]